jgi:hypothetical protein
MYGNRKELLRALSGISFMFGHMSGDTEGPQKILILHRWPRIEMDTLFYTSGARNLVICPVSMRINLSQRTVSGIS